MSKFKISNIILEQDTVLNFSHLHLWVWHADKIPPHIGISYDSRYYSLKANGKDEGLRTQIVLGIIKQRKMKSLLFTLSNSTSIERIENTFCNYSKATPFEATCLFPIRDILNEPKAEKLTDLLKELYSKGKIEKVIGFNLGSDFIGIEEYDQQAIQTRLRMLHDDR